jgi:RNA polymerase sigma factor (sigma-70 family)
MASNVAAEWAIRCRNKNPHDPRWLNSLTAADDPRRQFERDAAEREVHRAIVALGPKQHEMLKLYIFDGLGHAQIAERLGVTQRSVKRVLIKSYARLRQELEPTLLGELTNGRE